MYDAVNKRCSLPAKKVAKYLTRIHEMLSTKYTTSKELERLVGNLVWASYVEPWGRPFLSALSSKIQRRKPYALIPIIGYTKTSLVIWQSLLKFNRGITYNHILGKLERGKDAWFVDASTSWGIGGCAGYFYFMIENEQLRQIFAFYREGTQKELMDIPLQRLPIAYIELIAALVGISVFSKFQPNKLINLYTDNTDVVAWLRKGRCSAGLGFKLLAAVEFFKRKHALKISVKHIPGSQNNSADELSRGSVPTWLKLRGKRLGVDIHTLTRLVKNPLCLWEQCD